MFRILIGSVFLLYISLTCDLVWKKFLGFLYEEFFFDFVMDLILIWLLLIARNYVLESF